MSENGTYNFLFKRLDALTPLRKGLDAYAARQKVQSSNIANSETSGYRAKKVLFEDELRQAMRPTRTKLRRTSGEHIPISSERRRMDRLKHEVVFSTAGKEVNGNNNVDIDQEIADMATNQIQYATASKILSMRYKILKSAIKGHMSGV